MPPPARVGSCCGWILTFLLMMFLLFYCSRLLAPRWRGCCDVTLGVVKKFEGSVFQVPYHNIIIVVRIHNIRQNYLPIPIMMSSSVRESIRRRYLLLYHTRDDRESECDRERESGECEVLRLAGVRCQCFI